MPAYILPAFSAYKMPTYSTRTFKISLLYKTITISTVAALKTIKNSNKCLKTHHYFGSIIGRAMI